MDNNTRFKVTDEMAKSRNKLIHKIKDGFKKTIFDNKNNVYHLDLD
jgi:hypothetical protein